MQTLWKGKEMNDLTEKWKKGELINEEDAGCYYIETIDGEIYPDCLSPIDGFKNTYNYAVKKILAPVPSYAEWQKYVEANESMFSVVKMLNKDNYQLEKENTKLKDKYDALIVGEQFLISEWYKLKELLKECRPYVSRSATGRMIKNSIGHKKDMKLLAQIDKVLK